MIIGYGVFFLIACILWLFCWRWRYCRKSILLFICALIATLGFSGFVVADYWNVQANAARMHEAQTEAASGETAFENPLSEYQESVLRQEQDIMAQYVWNPHTTDLLDPENLESAGNIFRNVRLSKFYRSATYLSPDSEVYLELIRDPAELRGGSYHLSGTCVSSEPWENSQAKACFLPPTGAYNLQLVFCAWDAEDFSPAFAVLFPVSAQDLTASVPDVGDTYSCSATFAGTMLRDGVEVLVFMHS